MPSKFWDMEKNKQQTDIITDNFVSDIRTIIEQGRKQAYAATGQIAIMTYWNIGRRIVEEEQQGASRAAYGQKLIPALAARLSAEYGTGYGKRNLAYYRKFYLEFKDIEILHTRVQNLTWSHVRRLLSVSNTQAREWYLKAAAEDMWSVDDLDRNISTQYYERRLAAQRESSTLPVPYVGQTDPLEYIKNPMVAEFMGFRRDTSYSESELEQALIDNLEKFIMELGRGFAFVERQQHMKRFVIFELKTHKLTHQDIGQLDMYIRMYDDLVKGDDDNPTIGVLLCTDTDNTIAKYSVLHDSDQIFAAKYMTYMPTEEELRREIEQQKRFFMEQHEKEEE